MTTTKIEEAAPKLRAPFSAEAVGKLPRVTCGSCSRDKVRRHCDRHQRAKCDVCGSYITTQHMHLDYVGHAAITDRLLQVDPSWTWEPLALTEQGLPALDREGGLWIRLTVAGVTRLGYGDAEGKAGPASVKEAIGDALRNGAMRFGVGLDLWHKDGTLVQDETPTGERPTSPPPARRHADPEPAEPPPVSASSPVDRARADLLAACVRHGWDPRRVASRYKAQYEGEGLAAATDPVRVSAFAKLLAGVPQAELTALASVPADPAGAA